MSFSALRRFARSAAAAPIIRHALNVVSIMLTGSAISRPCPHRQSALHSGQNATDAPSARASENENKKA